MGGFLKVKRNTIVLTSHRINYSSKERTRDNRQTFSSCIMGHEVYNLDSKIQLGEKTLNKNACKRLIKSLNYSPKNKRRRRIE